MRLVRSWPSVVPAYRSYVVDGIERVVIDDYNYGTALRDLDDDVLLLEWDLAMGQEQLQSFARHAAAVPDEVLVAPYLLYPSGTGLPSTVWAHRRNYLQFVDEFEPTCRMFGLGMSYLPRHLLAAFDGERFDDGSFSTWHHEKVGVPVVIDWNVRPVHLNYKGYLEE